MNTETAHINKARDTLSTALMGLSGFLTLIRSGEELNGMELHCLLQPMESMFSDALGQIDDFVDRASVRGDARGGIQS